MFKKLLLICAITLFSAYSYGYDALEAVCKVHAGNSYGSGTCVDVHNNVAFVFTNYHVAGRTGSRVTCRFYNQGHESIEVPGEVIWTAFEPNGNIDQAMIALSLANMNGYVPKVIKFGDPTKTLQTGSPIITVGCPEAKWPALVEGHVIKNNNGVYYIKPPVENGRSGSALIDAETQTIVGIITWRSGDNYTGVGMAQDLATIYKSMSNQTYTIKYDVSDSLWVPGKRGLIFLPAQKYAHLPRVENKPFYVQIQCPDGGCMPYGFGINPRPYRESEPPNYNGNPYPEGGRLFPTLPQNPDDKTFPDQEQDFSSLVDKLDKLNDSNDSLTGGLNDLTAKVGALELSINDLGDKVTSNSNRLTGIEDDLKAVPGKLDGLARAVPGKIDAALKDYATKAEVEQEIGTLHQTVAATADAISSTNESLSATDNSIQEIIKNAEEVGMNSSDWYSLLQNALLTLLGVGGGGGFLAWGLNLLGKHISAGLSGSGGPSVPFPTKTVSQKKTK